jgi:hypothetical protein
VTCRFFAPPERGVYAASTSTLRVRFKFNAGLRSQTTATRVKPLRIGYISERDVLNPLTGSTSVTIGKPRRGAIFLEDTVPAISFLFFAPPIPSNNLHPLGCFRTEWAGRKTKNRRRSGHFYKYVTPTGFEGMA